MKKLIAVLFCAGYLINAQANSTITIEFQKDSEKFTEGTVRALSIYAEELYLAKGIKVTLQEPSRNAEAKKQALFYKRERELKEELQKFITNPQGTQLVKDTIKSITKKQTLDGKSLSFAKLRTLTA